jgi:hypothetical protein
MADVTKADSLSDDQVDRLLQEIELEIQAREEAAPHPVSEPARPSGGSPECGRLWPDRPIAPFDRLAGYITCHARWFSDVYAGFQACGEVLSGAIADAFNDRPVVGPYPRDFPAVGLDPDDLQAAFDRGGERGRPFERDAFDRLVGTWRGRIHTYQLSTGSPLPAITCFRDWDKSVASRGGYAQAIAGATKPILLEALPDLAHQPYDPCLDFYHPDLGIVSWLSFHELRRKEEPLVCFVLPDRRQLWVGQELNEDFTPSSSVYDVFLEWPGEHRGRRSYFMYGFQFRIVFDGCEVSLGDLIVKARFSAL